MKNSLTDHLQILMLSGVILSLCLDLRMCEEDLESFKLGEEFIESQTDITLIDTFSVSLSTVILDEVETSGREKMLIGNYNDNYLGKVASRSYFQIGIPVSIDIDQDDRYDSLNLILKYNGSFWGDTTRNQKINVYQLSENIDFNEENILTNRSNFNYNPNPIGTITYIPRPIGGDDNLLIKINDDIGLDLFNKLKDGADEIDDNDRFVDYFHGLALIADDAYEGVVIGFDATSSEAKLVLYTTRSVEYEIEEIEHEFGMYDSTKQFNQIIYDLSSTQLGSLTEQRHELPSANTNGLGFLQVGIGLLIRIDFPSLSNILMFEQGTMVKAELDLFSERTDDYPDISSSVYLYKSNITNSPQSLVASSSKTKTGEPYEEEIIYSFDVTDYLNNELNDSHFDTETAGLLLSSLSTTIGSTLERLIIDNNSPKTKLKIYYLTY